MPLQAGAAEIDISPTFGIQIAGDIGKIRSVKEIRDPLYAKALVLESGRRKVVILSLDIAVIGTERAHAIRDAVAAKIGTTRDAVLLHVTQNHSAPALGHCFTSKETPYFFPDHKWLACADDDYYPIALAGILEAVERANGNLEPVTVGAASGIEARVAFNRRFVMRDGSAVMHPHPGDPRIRHSEGPIDPEVGVVRFRNAEGEDIAVLLHYTCHPTHGYPQEYISADWPGTWADGVKELMGGKVVPLVLNGCCGNIHHQNHLDPHFVNDQNRMGMMLTETTRGALERIECGDVETLSSESRTIQAPWRALDPQAVADAQAMLAAFPEPKWSNAEHTQVDWAWVYAVSTIDLAEQMRSKPGYDYEILTIRIGDIALVGLPGEPFVEGQLAIKLASPTYPTYVAHMSNQYAGYIPTAKALERGGYETHTSNWSKLGPAALDEIVAATGEMLRGSFGDGGSRPPGL